MSSILYRFVNARLEEGLPSFLAQARGHPVTREHLHEHESRDHCRVVECPRPVVARGLCMTHYQRQRRTGSPLLVEVQVGGSTPYRTIADQLTAATGLKVSKSTVARWCEGT